MTSPPVIPVITPHSSAKDKEGVLGIAEVLFVAAMLLFSLFVILVNNEEQ